MHVDGGRTDFNQYSLQQMIAMLNAADSASIRATADSWHAVGQHLNGQANALQDMLPDFESKWQGGAATQYESMLTSLYTGVRQLANHANTMRDVLHDSADALDDAKAQMPAAVAIPDVSPSTVALATTPLQMMSPANPQEAAVLATRQQGAVAQVQAQQAAVAQAQAAHSQAAQIMTQLATRYSTNTASIPDSPAGADAAARYGSHSIGDTSGAGTLGGPGAGTPIDYSGNPLTGTPVTGIADDGSVTTVTDSPLFGGMIAAGLAAATAASAGRFGAVPTIPAFAQGDGTGKPKHPAGGAAAVGAGAAAAGAIRGFGGPGGPGPGGGGLAAASPTGFGQLVGGGSAPTAGLGGLPTAAGASSTGAAGMPMGAMPMGGGMGGGDGSGRRTPQWLVETEDVWGESSTVSPAVLGEN